MAIQNPTGHQGPKFFYRTDKALEETYALATRLREDLEIAISAVDVILTEVVTAGVSLLDGVEPVAEVA